MANAAAKEKANESSDVTSSKMSPSKFDDLDVDGIMNGSADRDLNDLFESQEMVLGTELNDAEQRAFEYILNWGKHNMHMGFR